MIVVQAERFTAEVVTTLRLMAATADRPVVLVIPDIDESQLITAVECQVVAHPAPSIGGPRPARAQRPGGRSRAVGSCHRNYDIGRTARTLPADAAGGAAANGLTLSGLT